MKIKHITSIALFATLTVPTFAQRDAKDMDRKVVIEKEYNPTLSEVEKINVQPQTSDQVQLKAPKTKLLEESPNLRVVANQVNRVQAEILPSANQERKQIGYANFAAGAYGTIDGQAGIRPLNTETDIIDLWGLYNGMSGNIKHKHSTPMFLDKTKAKYHNAQMNLKYVHKFTPSTLSFEANYKNLGYNYYGTPFGLNESTIGSLTDGTFNEKVRDSFNTTTKQKVNILTVGARLQSSLENQGFLKYDGELFYTHFSTKENLSPILDPTTALIIPKGNIFKGKIDLSTDLGSFYVGGIGKVVHQSFSKDFSSYTNISATPYIKFEDINWNVTLGANLNYTHDENNKFYVAPYIKTNYTINEANTFYANIGGGINNNLFIDVLQENPYINFNNRPSHSKTPYDIQLGFKTGAISNIELEIFGGYKKINDDYLFESTTYLAQNATGNILNSWSNTFNLVYDNIGIGHIGGLVKVNLIPFTTLSLRSTAFMYNTKTLDKAYGRPKFTTELIADVKPIDNLTLNLNYNLQSGRTGLYNTQYNNNGLIKTSIGEVKMSSISELNIGATYQLLDWIAIHAQVNNLMNRKQEQYLGYTLQGISVIGGFNLKF